ncbi:MAG TPA: 5'/3'-nucleotidase SurE [Nitrososphaerales archaeon]|nr:5'/3'-nucleotidase SurE [Nitrososphaerales archaeon]
MDEDVLIMVSNDDGVTSPGITALADAASSLGSVMIIAPEGEQSAAAMSLTFNRPLRVTKVHVGKRVCYAVSGTPADSTMIGIHNLLPRRPDAVVSGINLGENLTIQDILASGTVAAALSAALLGIPAIAFSMEIPPGKTIPHGRREPNFAIPARIAAEIISEVLEHGMPRGADMLNVNFPWGTTWKTPVKITTLEARKWRDSVLERNDPRGRPYYWIWGSRLPSFRRDSDAYTVHKRRAISISPLSLDLTPKNPGEFKGFQSKVASRLRKVMDKSSSTHK